MQSVDKNMQLNDWSFLNFSENDSREKMKPFDYFYYINRRLPTDNNLISAPDEEIPDFLNLWFSDQKIFTLLLYKLFRGTKSYGLVCTQFICALNIYLSKNRQISKDAMAGFYHNLSMQALSKSKYKITLDFTWTSKLVKSINPNLQKMIFLA